MMTSEQIKELSNFIAHTCSNAERIKPDILKEFTSLTAAQLRAANGTPNTPEGSFALDELIQASVELRVFATALRKLYNKITPEERARTIATLNKQMREEHIKTCPRCQSKENGGQCNN